jgi:photosystem II stability/assembly factor-like uncharacterized protein
MAVAALGMLTAAACQSGAASANGLPTGGHVHALNVLQDGELLLGLHGSLYRSAEGHVWESAGLEDEDAMAIAAVSEDAPIFVAGHDLLTRSADGGKTFQPLRPDGLPSLDIHAFAQAPSDPETLYGYVVGAGIFASSDAGQTWELRAPARQSIPEDILTLAVHPEDPETVLAGGGGSGVFRSTDGARTFGQVSQVGAGSLAVRGDDPDRVVALTARGIEVSDDGGQSWEVVSVPREAGIDGQPVAIASGGGDTVLMITEQPRTLQRSDDGGRTWGEVATASE